MEAPKIARTRYSQHKAGAAARGLAFTLTFDQWWALWEPYWDRRGKGGQQMCMCRTADKGGYEPGNVRIATNRENNHERSLEYRTRHAQRRSSYTSNHALKAFGQAPVDWTIGRDAFREYEEEEEEGL